MELFSSQTVHYADVDFFGHAILHLEFFFFLTPCKKLAYDENAIFYF